MNDLISRSALLAKTIGVVVYDEGGWDCNVRAVPDHVVENAPTIEAEPVRHGRWEPMLDRVWNLPNPVLSGWRCSECGRTENEKDPYCNCGCKMDGDDHEA